ncbi:MAG: phospholipid carrier-dependent glycosyltransferase [Desulfobacteraceae bacterium]|nr:MAG: phospholipid carrier-dependent glycosyltransferase [Desulfobacteraceae bacterium]
MQGQISKVIEKTPGSSLIYFILAGFITILIVSIILLSSVPPVCRDSLTHHLAVPKLYLNHGGMYEIPSVIFSYYPMNLELLYIIPLYFGNDIVPKYIHFVFALLTAIIVYGYLKKRTDRIFALFGALFFLSIPVIVKLSITVYVDLGLIFFSTGAIIYLFKWIESEFKLKHLLVSAVFCGLALGTKYNALIVFFLLSLFVIFYYSRISSSKEKQRGSIKRSSQVSMKALFFGALYIFIVLLVFSPWMIRNYVWTKNPVYPLYQGFFNRINAEPVPVLMDQGGILSEESIKNNKSKDLSPFAIRRIIYNESLLQIVLLPIRIFFEGEDNNPKYFDGKLFPFLFILPFFAFYRIKQDSNSLKVEKEILLSFSILFILFAFSKTDMRIRYIAPVIPPLVMLSVMGLHNIFSMLSSRFSVLSGKMFSFCLFFFFAVVISVNGVYIIQQFRLVNPVGYLRGDIGRDEYIEKYRPEYAAIKYANNNLSEDAKILCFFLGNRSYYSDREMLFDVTILKYSLSRSDMPEKIISDMKKEEITHLMIWYNMFNSWVNNNFNADEKALLSRFFKENTTLLFSKSGHGLYELNPGK